MLMMATLFGPATTALAPVAGAALVSAACAKAPMESRAAMESEETILRVIGALKNSLIPLRSVPSVACGSVSGECRPERLASQSDRLTLPGPDLLRGVLAGT